MSLKNRISALLATVLLIEGQAAMCLGKDAATQPSPTIKLEVVGELLSIEASNQTVERIRLPFAESNFVLLNVLGPDGNVEQSGDTLLQSTTQSYIEPGETYRGSAFVKNVARHPLLDGKYRAYLTFNSSRSNETSFVVGNANAAQGDMSAVKKAAKDFYLEADQGPVGFQEMMAVRPNDDRDQRANDILIESAIAKQAFYSEARRRFGKKLIDEADWGINWATKSVLDDIDHAKVEIGPYFETATLAPAGWHDFKILLRRQGKRWLVDVSTFCQVKRQLEQIDNASTNIKAVTVELIDGKIDSFAGLVRAVNLRMSDSK